MSVQALQRVAVRMLYDEAFAGSVYADPARATADCDLTHTERSWLLAPDPRAWRVDPLRRSRTLAGLLEEFPVSVALFVRATPGGTARLDSFFSSQGFHRGMQAGASLAEVFAAWLGEQSGAGAEDLLRLEAALARVRRQAELVWPERPAAPAAPGGVFVLAPALEVLEVRAGTVRDWSAILGALRQGPVAARTIDPGLELPRIPMAEGEEGVLVDGRGADPRLEPMSVELARVLAGAVRPVDFAGFSRRAAAHGADEEDCRSIVESFAADGILEAVDQANPSIRPPW